MDSIKYNYIRKQINQKLFKYCRYQNIRHKVCFNKACKQCYNKSLQSHYNCEYFNYNANYHFKQYIYHPRFIIKKSNRPCEFICKCNKIYTNTPINATYRRIWCRECINRNKLLKASKFYDQFSITFNNNELLFQQKPNIDIKYY